MTERLCVRCGADISHRDARSRHCSSLCRNRDYEGSVIGTVRACAYCAASFMPSKNPQVFCSSACRARSDVERNREEYNRRGAARRARERAADVGERFTRVEVFERDHWICQLCLAPINRWLRGRGRYAPALDHILPLNKGGLHTFDNCQAAHSGCNASKHDRTDIILLPPPNYRPGQRNRLAGV